MYSIGIDAHRKYSQISVMNKEGKIIKRLNVNNDMRSIKEALEPYAHNGSKAVLESSWNWGLLYDMFSDCIDEVKVAHPLKVKTIAEAKIKTDKISADILAHLLRADLIPECYVRDRENQRIQQVLRQKMFMVRLQTMVKNKIHNLIDRQELARKEAQSYTDLFGTKGMQFLRSVELPVLERKLLDGQLELLEELRTRIKSIDSSMKLKKGSNSAKVATARRLLKIVYQVWKENRFYKKQSLRTALVAC